MRTRTRMWLWSALALVVLQASRAQADAPPPGKDSEMELFRLDEALQHLSLKEEQQLRAVTATRTDETTLYDSPSTVRVVTAADLAANGYVDLESVLHDLPGFDFDRGFGVSYSTIFMRGFRSSNSDRFLLVYDDVLENDIWKQDVNISHQYTLSNIKRIEVQYGPASALWGTNAFSGIINVITKEGREVGPGNAWAGYGSYGRKLIEASSGWDWLNGLVGYDVSARYFAADDLHPWSYMRPSWPNSFSNDYASYYNQPVIAVPTENRMIAGTRDGTYPYDDWSVHANAYLRPKGGGKLKLTFLHWETRENEGYWYIPAKRSALTRLDEWRPRHDSLRLSHDISYKWLTNQASLTWRMHEIAPSADVNQTYKNEPDASDPNINPADPSTYKIVNSVYTGANGRPLVGYASYDYYYLRTWDLIGEEQLSYAYKDRLVATGGLRIDYVDTQEDYYIIPHKTEDAGQAAVDADPHRHQRTNAAFYTQIKWQAIKKYLLLYAGGRLELQRDENGDGYTTAVPRLSVLSHPTQDVTLRLQYSEAFQQPDDFHRYATDPGTRPDPSPNLKPETLRAVELGGNWVLRNLVALDLAVYFNDVQDLIIEVPNPRVPGTIMYANHDAEQIWGYEIGVRVRPTRALDFQASFSGAWNYLKEGSNYRLYGDIAPLKFHIGGSGHFFNDALTVSLAGNYVSERRTINWQLDPATQPVVTQVGEYFVFNAYVAWVPLRGPHRLEIGVRLDNIFDATYYDPGPRSATGSYNGRVLQPGFNYFAQVKASY